MSSPIARPAWRCCDAYGPHTNEILIRDGPDFKDFGAVGSRAYLRQCAYLSARRLGLESIDLYYLHSATATDASFEPQITTLAELRQEGVIRQPSASRRSFGGFGQVQFGLLPC